MTERFLQTRREFCVHACQAVSVLAVAAPGCGGPMGPSASVPALTAVSGSLANGAITIPIDATSPLAAVGGAAQVETSAGQFLLTRTGQATFSALTAVCTHSACLITGFSTQNLRFVCFCHGSQFHTDGRVARGPASSPLRAFPTQFADNVLTVTV